MNHQTNPKSRNCETGGCHVQSQGHTIHLFKYASQLPLHQGLFPFATEVALVSHSPGSSLGSVASHSASTVCRV